MQQKLPQAGMVGIASTKVASVHPKARASTPFQLRPTAEPAACLLLR